MENKAIAPPEEATSSGANGNIEYDNVDIAGKSLSSAGGPATPDKFEPEWKSVVRELFPNLVPVMEACMANICALLLSDLSNCPALVLVGPASSSKTTALEMFQASFVYESDSFTPKSFVSHASNVERDKLTGEVDLLPRIQHKVMVVKDLSPVLSRRQDELEEAIGVLTRVLDGRGYQSDSGVHGQRGYRGDYRFGMLAATTPPDKKAWKVMSKLGPRLLFLTVELEPETEEERIDTLLSEVSYWDKVEVARKAVSDYLIRLWEENGGFGGVAWDKPADDRQLVENLVRLTNLGVMLRAQPAKEKTSQYDDTDYEFTPAVVEGPERYLNLLYNLARGHAIAEGRQQLAEDDVKLVARVTLGSGPEQRRKLLKGVLTQEEPLTVDEAAKAIGCTRPTAEKIISEMVQLGIVASVRMPGRTVVELTAKHEWLRKFLGGV